MNVKRDYACTNNPNIKFDHYPIFFDVPLTDSDSVNQSQTKKQFKSWRNIRNLDIDAFMSALSDIYEQFTTTSALKILKTD